MTAEEFRDLVRQRNDSELLDPCLRDDDIPYAFDPRPQAWNEFRDEVASRIGATRTDIRVVGSGRFGFSLKPGRNLRRFTDSSDIDVVVVNAALFDQLWLALLEAVYPRPPAAQRLNTWLQIRRSELYTGWLTPREIDLNVRVWGLKARPVRDFRSRWFNTLKEASSSPTRRHHEPPLPHVGACRVVSSS